MKFFVLRVMLVAQDNELCSKKGIQRDIGVFESSIKYASTQIDEEALYSMTIDVEPDDENQVMSGKISKAKVHHLYDRSFKEFDVDSFVPVHWLWDRKEQVILVEVNKKVFQTAASVAKAFEDISNNIVMVESGYRSHIRPHVIERSFWEEYEKFPFIHKAEFELVAPNLFGSTKKELTAMLNNVSEETNASIFKPSFENPDGNLNLKGCNWVTILLDWIKHGGGNWVLKGKKSPTSKIDTIKSERTPQVLNLDGSKSGIEEDSTLLCNAQKASNLSTFFDNIRPRYSFKKRSKGND